MKHTITRVNYKQHEHNHVGKANPEMVLHQTGILEWHCRECQMQATIIALREEVAYLKTELSFATGKITDEERAEKLDRYEKLFVRLREGLFKFYDRNCVRPKTIGGIEDEYGKETYWFNTTEFSKVYAIGLLEELIESKPTALPFHAFWEEAMTFTVDNSGRMGADGKRLDPTVKNFDDIIIAAAMCQVGNVYAPSMSYTDQPPAGLSDYERRKWESKHRTENSVVASLPAELRRDPSGAL